MPRGDWLWCSFSDTTMEPNGRRNCVRYIAETADDRRRPKPVHLKLFHVCSKKSARCTYLQVYTLGDNVGPWRQSPHTFLKHLALPFRRWVHAGLLEQWNFILIEFIYKAPNIDIHTDPKITLNAFPDEVTWAMVKFSKFSSKYV
jgi:hypothetical protein